MQPNPPYGRGPLGTVNVSRWAADAKSPKPRAVAESTAFLDQWELDLRDGHASRSTMAGQVTDILDDVMLDAGVENVVDKLQESFGTVDLDAVDFEDIWAVIRDE